MKLSIITCTYNSEKYLQECIDSVIAQNLSKEGYEHIFVDAYSTDKSKSIIEKYMKRYSNVKLIERKPKWIYNAMNEWIKEANWEYILCLNSDDFLEPNILNEYLDYIKHTWNLDIYFWKVNNVCNNKIVYITTNNFIRLRKFLFINFWCHVLLQHPAMLIKRELFFWDIGLFDESKRISSDYGLFIKCLVLGKKFVFFPKVVSNFRIHNWSISSNWKNNKLAAMESNYFKRKYFPIYKVVIWNWIELLANIFGRLINSNNR